MDDQNNLNNPNPVPTDPAPEEKPVENPVAPAANSPISFVQADSSMPPMGPPIKADEPPQPKVEEVKTEEPKDENDQLKNLGIPLMIATVGKPRKKGGKILATIFAVLFMVAAVGAGVYLTQRSQDVREKAVYEGIPCKACKGLVCKSTLTAGCDSTANTCTTDSNCNPNYCSTLGDRKCSGTTTQYCSGNTWINGSNCSTTNKLCKDGLCVTPTDDSNPVVSPCKTCNSVSACISKSGSCDPGINECDTSADCASCTNGKTRCNGTKFQVCSRGEWVTGTNCADYGKICINDSTKLCVDSGIPDTGTGGGTGGGTTTRIWPPDGTQCSNGTTKGCIVYYCPQGCNVSGSNPNPTCGENSPGVYTKYFATCTQAESNLSSQCGQIDTVNTNGAYCYADVTKYKDSKIVCSSSCTRPPAKPPTTPEAPQCLNVKAYDVEWNLLTTADLSALKAGDKVRFTVAGSATSGTFDKARFIIGGETRTEVTQKKPNTQEFYDEYTIPEGVTSFTINAEVHHSTAGWF